jgi:hypothetical protein
MLVGYHQVLKSAFQISRRIIEFTKSFTEVGETFSYSNWIVWYHSTETSESLNFLITALDIAKSQTPWFYNLWKVLS